MNDMAERFEKLFQPEPNSGCWLWIGALLQNGYAQFSIESRSIRAHRASWEIHCGPIPGDAQVLHRCDMPACVNPDHLFLGDDADNMHDKIAKGRARYLRGADQPIAKLTDDQVRAIRDDARPSHAIAPEYNVSSGQIRRIKRRRDWRHLP
jgi:hypothetical protein